MLEQVSIVLLLCCFTQLRFPEEATCCILYEYQAGAGVKSGILSKLQMDPRKCWPGQHDVGGLEVAVKHSTRMNLRKFLRPKPWQAASNQSNCSVPSVQPWVNSCWQPRSVGNSLSHLSDWHIFLGPRIPAQAPHSQTQSQTGTFEQTSLALRSVSAQDHHELRKNGKEGSDLHGQRWMALRYHCTADPSSEITSLHIKPQLQRRFVGNCASRLKQLL